MEVLERESHMAAMARAAESAARGDGGALLLSGEAGIGKTTLVDAFVRALPSGVRVLRGACDDLIAPRTLGPLWDAAHALRGPLATALTGRAERDTVFGAVLHELSGPPRPVVLVIEDAQWADDATLDLLRLLARRLAGLPAVLVLTYRDEELGEAHPLRRVLGAYLGAHVHRLALPRLSADAVRRLAEGRADPAAVMAATAGNPFFVTEMLASPNADVPATVADAVRARLAQLDDASRQRVEQLAVVAAPAGRPLVETLPGGVTGLARAEQAGMVRVTDDAVVFRHELARRAIEAALPSARRIAYHRLVLALLLDQPEPDLPRVVHHAVEAGNAVVIARDGPRLAELAAAAGAHRQALAVLDQVLRHDDQLDPRVRARSYVGYAWALHNALRIDDAVAAAQTAVRLWSEIGDDVGLGEALMMSSREEYLAGRPRRAVTDARRAVALFEAHPAGRWLALARTYWCALLVLTDAEQEALAILDGVLALAERVAASEAVALAHSYRGLARARLGDPSGVADLREGLALSGPPMHHEFTVRAHCNAVDGLRHLGRDAEERRQLAAALDYAQDRDLVEPIYECYARHWVLAAARGDWDAAEAGLRDLAAVSGRRGVIGYLVLPALGRLLIRTGRLEEGTALLDEAWVRAREADVLAALAPAAIALVERDWLIGDHRAETDAVPLLLTRTNRPGAHRHRGELLRYLARARSRGPGPTAPATGIAPFPGCPPEYAAGLRGDWHSAATAWETIGDLYEQALELAESGQEQPTLQALSLLDDLGARPAAALVRARLRRDGATRIPRGPRPRTRENPAGLTERQVDVLGLVAQGLTNAEIAGRLVLSTRTVDHHVAAILTKLDVANRRDAGRRAAELGLT